MVKAGRPAFNKGMGTDKWSHVLRTPYPYRYSLAENVLASNMPPLLKRRGISVPQFFGNLKNAIRYSAEYFFQGEEIGRGVMFHQPMNVEAVSRGTRFL